MKWIKYLRRGWGLVFVLLALFILDLNITISFRPLRYVNDSFYDDDDSDYDDYYDRHDYYNGPRTMSRTGSNGSSFSRYHAQYMGHDNDAADDYEYVDDDKRSRTASPASSRHSRRSRSSRGASGASDTSFYIPQITWVYSLVLLSLSFGKCFIIESIIFPFFLLIFLKIRNIFLPQKAVRFAYFYRYLLGPICHILLKDPAFCTQQTSMCGLSHHFWPLLLMIFFDN